MSRTKRQLPMLPRTEREQLSYRQRLGLDPRLPRGFFQSSFVYFIEAGAGGAIKIGVGWDVVAKLRALQPHNHEALVCLAVVPGTVEDERALHARFADARIRGEWFAPVRELQIFIARVRAKGALS